jgi:hypothetical protein
MKIVKIRLTNFVGVYAAMGLHDICLEFDKVDKPIIQIYGRNRCGKTVLLQQLHPFSSINLNGDERSDLSLILKGETGIKEIVYEINGDVYSLVHTYKPTNGGNHTITSSFMHNGTELNPSGGVNTFNHLVEKVFGINKYLFQFVINGTQLTSFANMGVSQRKTLLNKAMGIDIYDKIHKLATDDYRYTSKLISSLNNTREYILSKYGSYEELCNRLNELRTAHELGMENLTKYQSYISTLQGKIQTIQSQNIDVELMRIQNVFTAYKNVVDEMGTFSPDMYDKLVDQQIQLNNDKNKKESERMLIMKDMDILYEKKTSIENEQYRSNKARHDYDEMIRMRDDLIQKIANIDIQEEVEIASSYLMNMLSLAQIINSTCKEISTCLNEKHLGLFCDMIIQGIDVSAFLIQEGSILMDSEKEKSAISRIRSMMNSIEGDIIDDCVYGHCLYRQTYDKLNAYFHSYSSSTNSKFTQYDLEQIEHAWKNVQTIQRLINTEIPEVLQFDFTLPSIMTNLKNNKYGIDVSRIQYFIEEAGKMEQKKRYITQLENMKTSIENMESLLSQTTSTGSIDGIVNDIQSLQSRISDIDQSIQLIDIALQTNERQRSLLSQIKNVDISDYQKQNIKFSALKEEMLNAQQECARTESQMQELKTRLVSVGNELKQLEDANNQYQSTLAEIDCHTSKDHKYKIISEATSSTKGKPVITIREKMEEALFMANRLLDVMYDGEIELLPHVIDETSFTLPFRCGTNTSEDIRYGSQSESTLLSLAVSLSLASSMLPDFIPTVDELDAYLDGFMHEGFLMMLQEIMSTLKLEQMFLISHSIDPTLYENAVYCLNLSDEIDRLKALENK